MYTCSVFLITTVFAFLANYVITLECFSCYGSGDGNRCDNYSTYENAWKEGEGKRKENPLFKNCAAPFDKICYIETYSIGGNVISHIRDCGDGESFTFNNTKDKSIHYNRLWSMKRDNETVCVFDFQYMVCLSMCTDDYCNGPTHYVITLECFSCYGNGAGNRCENYSTYENAWKEDEEKRKENPLFKNCTEPFDQICYIETYYEEGNVISHIRDCGDGETFTFNGDKEKSAYYDRLRSMKRNNETVCVFDLQYMVCLSMCTDDYCNGPSKAVGLAYSTVGTFIVAVISICARNLIL